MPDAVRWTPILTEAAADAKRGEAGRAAALPEAETAQGTGANTRTSSAPNSAAQSPCLENPRKFYFTALPQTAAF
jgi:hypothetical protein